MDRKQLNLMAGSFNRVFLYVMLAYIVEHGNIWSIDWKAAINAAVLGGISVLINYFNPNDPRYGNKEKPDKVA